MRVRRGEGIVLSWDCRKALNSWGVAEINWRAAQLIPLRPAKLEELADLARETESEHVKVRHAYVEHVANCLTRSKKIEAL